MALQNCHECQKQISNQAASCPYCGAPALKPKASKTVAVASLAGKLLLAVLFVAVVGAYWTIQHAQSIVQESKLDAQSHLPTPSPTPPNANVLQVPQPVADKPTKPETPITILTQQQMEVECELSARMDSIALLSRLSTGNGEADDAVAQKVADWAIARVVPAAAANVKNIEGHARYSAQLGKSVGLERMTQIQATIEQSSFDACIQVFNSNKTPAGQFWTMGPMINWTVEDGRITVN